MRHLIDEHAPVERVGVELDEDHEERDGDADHDRRDVVLLGVFLLGSNVVLALFAGADVSDVDPVVGADDASG